MTQPHFRTLIAGMALAMACTQTASACVTVKVYNDSDSTINAAWRALGCGGIDKRWNLVVCANHDIAPHDSRSHDFDWGKSAQQVMIGFDGVGNAEGKWVDVKFTYHKDEGNYRKSYSGTAQTPPKCHSHYTIHYTNADIIKDSEDAYERYEDSSNRDSE